MFHVLLTSSKKNGFLGHGEASPVATAGRRSKPWNTFYKMFDKLCSASHSETNIRTISLLSKFVLDCVSSLGENFSPCAKTPKSSSCYSTMSVHALRVYIFN